MYWAQGQPRFLIIVPSQVSMYINARNAAVVSLSGGTERAQSKINQLLKFVSEIQKGMRGGGGDGQM